MGLRILALLVVMGGVSFAANDWTTRARELGENQKPCPCLPAGTLFGKLGKLAAYGTATIGATGLETTGYIGADFDKQEQEGCVAQLRDEYNHNCHKHSRNEGTPPVVNTFVIDFSSGLIAQGRVKQLNPGPWFYSSKLITVEDPLNVEFFHPTTQLWHKLPLTPNNWTITGAPVNSMGTWGVQNANPPAAGQTIGTSGWHNGQPLQMGGGFFGSTVVPEHISSFRVTQSFNSYSNCNAQNVKIDVLEELKNIETLRTFFQ